MGDMNWHAHVGITTLPVRVAAQLGIPLVVWGEHGYLDLGGQFSFDDFPEMSYRDRLEHFARGFEWNYFVGLEGLAAQDLLPFRYPEDQELYDFDVRRLYLGTTRWEAMTRAFVERYGFGCRRAVRPDLPAMSNLDDIRERADYLKWKFGYGRCTDKDIARVC